jgi:hypothetical protein
MNNAYYGRNMPKILQARATVLLRLAGGGQEGEGEALLEGIDPSLLSVAPRGLAGIHGFKKKKKKRGPNKWMPFRYPLVKGHMKMFLILKRLPYEINWAIVKNF